MTALIDTNFICALYIANDLHHEEARAVFSDLKNEQSITTVSVLSELFYLINKFVGYSSAIKSLKDTRQFCIIESLEIQDLNNMESIMTRYVSARFDYTDVALMALAQRLNIKRIYTFDRRDFSIFRPQHCDTLDLLP